MMNFYLMNCGPLTKLILLQSSLAFLDGEATFTGKDPLVAFLETDATIAFCYLF